MRMAVKTSPITAAPPFSVHLRGERERADGFTLSVLAGETVLGRTGFARWCASEYTVSPFHPISPLLGHFGPEPTPATFASVAIDPKETCRRKRCDECLSFKGPSQPGNRRRNDLTRIAAETQHQRRLLRCLNIQAAHCTNDDAVFSRRPFDRDVR